MRIIVTAGPTREFLDDVRFLSNASSGRMGFAVAAAAVRAGHDVTLIAGPVSLPTPEGAERVDVVTADQMRREALARFDACDALVKAAAVCDYRPAERQPGKIKKDGRELLLRLAPNPDILAELGRRKAHRLLVGFALEPTLRRQEALRKLRTKGLDAIVLNSTSALGAEKSTVEIITKAGEPLVLQNMSKAEIAERLVALFPTLRE